MEGEYEWMNIDLFQYPNPASNYRVGVIRKVENVIQKMEENPDESFNIFLVDENIGETCRVYDSLDQKAQKLFIEYLNALMSALFECKKEWCLEMLMRYQLPLDLYMTHSHILRNMVRSNSNINLFRLYFTQDHSMETVKGRIEETIVDFGNVDILDYFLSLETPESGHIFHSDIVTHVCVIKNVDMLDRLINKGYSVNEPDVYGVYPIEYSFAVRYRETYILERLIMAGANVNVRENTDRKSILMKALDCNINPCSQLLLDMGARVNNFVDVEWYFLSCDIKRETLSLLVKAGMDLNYITEKLGTPIDMVTKRYFLNREKREEAIALIRELGGR